MGRYRRWRLGCYPCHCDDLLDWSDRRLSLWPLLFWGGQRHAQTIPTVVREINQEYEGKLGEIESSVAHDRLKLSGSRALWPEVLAVYAVKTTTDPDDPQEVVTMDDGKKDF